MCRPGHPVQFVLGFGGDQHDITRSVRHPIVSSSLSNIISKSYLDPVMTKYSVPRFELSNMYMCVTTLLLQHLMTHHFLSSLFKEFLSWYWSACAGGIGSFAHGTYHSQCTWHSKKVIMGFAYEYTYQDHEYIIRTMNTKHAPCIHSACRRNRRGRRASTPPLACNHTQYIQFSSSCTQDCLSCMVHLRSSCSDIASQL